MTPDQFLEWAKTVDPTEVQDSIDKYAEGLKEGVSFNFKIDMRSFLRHTGFNSLPKAKITYNLQAWHRGYKKEEIKKLLSYLDDPIQKLYVLIAIETGLRANTILDIRYKHIQEDLEAGIVPVAVRFEPRYYTGKKSAGFCFLGDRSVTLLRECIKNRLVTAKSESPIFEGRFKGEKASYAAMYDALSLARKKAGLDPKIQVNHGLRKTFEAGLDQAGIDHEQKMVIEGHFQGARGHHYTDREWENLRPIYKQAYPHLDVEGSNPEFEKKLIGWEQEKQDMRHEIAELKELVKGLLKEKRK